MKKILLLLVATTIIACTSNKSVVNNTSQKENFDFRLTQKKKMPHAAYDFGAELYKGKIYAFLSNPGISYRRKKLEGNYGDVCVYDIQNNTWTKVNTIPKTIKGATSTIIGSKIYLVGTYEGDIIQVYNIESNSWEQSIKMPLSFHFTSVEAFDGKLYTFGGYAVNREISYNVQILDDVFIYDTVTKKWSDAYPYPRKASGLNSLKYKDEFYVWSRNEAYKYNPKKNKWSKFTSLVNKLGYSQEGVVLNDHFYFINGRYGNGSSMVVPDKWIYSYALRTKEFIRSNDLLLNSRRRSFNVFSFEDKIYILGGKDAETEEAMNDVVVLEIK